MNDPEQPSSSSASVNAQGDANISGDVVGRDKFETHQHIQQAASFEEGWEMLEAGGRVTKTLINLGQICMFSAFPIGLVGILALFMFGPVGLIVGGVGAMLLFIAGFIMYMIGWNRASHALYRQRRNSRRQ